MPVPPMWSGMFLPSACKQSTCGACTQSLHLLLSGSLVCRHDLQPQVDALKASLLSQLLGGLCEASCTDACRKIPKTDVWELRILDLGPAGRRSEIPNFPELQIHQVA